MKEEKRDEAKRTMRGEYFTIISRWEAKIHKVMGFGFVGPIVILFPKKIKYL